MKYGFLFLTLGSVLGWHAIDRGSWLLVVLWPASTGLLVGLAYLRRRPGIFGKRPDGSMNPFSVLLLLPYLACLWIIWHCLRIVQRENPFDRLDDRLVIGRRLLGPELPAHVDNVVDLTCEFPEPGSVARRVNYLSFPILDASVCPIPDLQRLVRKIDSLPGTTLVHCAQGHGRTGMVTAALLMSRDEHLTAGAAITQIQAVRPKLDCNREQMAALEQMKVAGP